MDRIVTGITEDGGIVCYAIDATDLVARAAVLHQTAPVVTSALGRLLIGASLIGSQLKNKDETITLRMKGDGPIGALVAVSDYDGNVRGYAEHRLAEVPLTPSGHLDVGTAVGKNGTLTVMRELGAGLEPAIGTIELATGEIGEDLTAYYAYSEQIPSAFSLGVQVDLETGRVLYAGGFLAQRLPGALDESIDLLEQNIAKHPSVTKMLAEGKTPEDVVALILEGMTPGIINTMPVEYRCDCTRERVERALISLGVEELKQMQEEEEVVEVSCHFCNKKYKFNNEELDVLISQLEKQ